MREDVAPHDSDAISVRVDEQAAKKVHAIVGNDPQMLVEQVRCEANELAFHLQGQQRDVDHREAEYCSGVAQIENELRVARLVLREREQELAEGELQLGQRLLDLEHRAVQAIACQRAAQQSGVDDKAAGPAHRRSNKQARAMPV